MKFKHIVAMKLEQSTTVLLKNWCQEKALFE